MSHHGTVPGEIGETEMINHTKTRIIDLRCKLHILAGGDILTAYQAREIGWMTFRNFQLECVDYDSGNSGQKLVKLQALSLEISGCTSWKR